MSWRTKIGRWSTQSSRLSITVLKTHPGPGMGKRFTQRRSAAAPLSSRATFSSNIPKPSTRGWQTSYEASFSSFHRIPSEPSLPLLSYISPPTSSTRPFSLKIDDPKGLESLPGGSNEKLLMLLSNSFYSFFCLLPSIFLFFSFSFSSFLLCIFFKTLNYIILWKRKNVKQVDANRKEYRISQDTYFIKPLGKTYLLSPVFALMPKD